MSNIDFEEASRFAKSLAQQVNAHNPDLMVSFVLYHAGQMRESLNLAAQDYAAHYGNARSVQVFRRDYEEDETGILGSIFVRRTWFFGLLMKESYTSVCALNLDHFETIRDLRFEMYRQVWRVLGMQNRHKPPEKDMLYISENKPLEMSDILIWNLSQDVFAALMASLEGDDFAIQGILESRLQALFSRTVDARPEHFPFLLADQSTKAALSKLREAPPYRKDRMNKALEMTEMVLSVIETLDLKVWLSFARAAQAMVWMGYDVDEVLAACVFTSPNTRVRILGSQASDVLEVKPKDLISINMITNIFAHKEQTEKLHKKYIQNILGECLSRTATVGTIDPFVTMANTQNKRLLKGHVFGWCAWALHRAGIAYEGAERAGENAADKAVETFHAALDTTEWDLLISFALKVMSDCRQNGRISIENVLDIAASESRFWALKRSLIYSVNDPAAGIEEEPSRKMASA